MKISSKKYCSIFQKVNKARSLGINDLIIDPGFGFAKTIEQIMKYYAKQSC
jgi:dihydropteroate synthase